MKKDNKMFTIIAIVAIVGVLVGFGLATVINRVAGKAQSNEKPYTVSNLKESTKKIPNFEIRLTGDFDGVINDEFTTEDNIKMYEFDATVTDIWGYTTNHYVGFKLKELLDFYQVTNFTMLTFKSIDKISVKYDYGDITDNTFLVVYKDDQLVSDTSQPLLLAVDYAYRYSLADVSEMEFYSGDNDRVENDTTGDENDTDDNQTQQDEQ